MDERYKYEYFQSDEIAALKLTAINLDKIIQTQNSIINDLQKQKMNDSKLDVDWGLMFLFAVIGFIIGALII